MLSCTTATREMFSHSENWVGAVAWVFPVSPRDAVCVCKLSRVNPQLLFSQKHSQRRSTLKDWIILQLQFSAICELPASVTLRTFCLLKQLYEVQRKKLNSHFISITLYCVNSMDLAVNRAQIFKRRQLKNPDLRSFSKRQIT